MTRRNYKSTYNQDRTIYVNFKDKSNTQFPTNFIETSKYTLINFIPKSIMA